MNPLEVDLGRVDPDGTLTLTVGWRSGQKTKMARIDVHSSVEASFRDVIRETVDDLDSRSAEPWAPDADLTPETYLVAPYSVLGQSPVLAGQLAEFSLVQAFSTASTIEMIDPSNLPVADMTFYAYTVDLAQGGRATFLRRNNPRRGLRRGRIFTGLEETLVEIKKPIFAFDGAIDLIFAHDHVFVLSQSVFVAIFRDQEALQKQIPGWVEELNDHVPIVENSRNLLAERAQKDTRIRTRLEAIVKRGHLPSVSSERLLAAMQASQLDSDALISANSELQFEDEDVPRILYFLNEDLFSGALTDTNFRADKKALR